jgi:hypothetical protein
MGTFLDHLRDAEGQRRTLDEREKRERAEIREDYAKRQASRTRTSVVRSHESSPVPGSERS